MLFSSYLKRLREEAGLSKTDLSKKMGVSLVYYSKLESHSNYKPPNAARCDQISEILNLGKEQAKTLHDLAFKQRNEKEISGFHLSKDSAVEIELNSSMVKVPILGSCPASAKHWVNDEVEAFENISKTVIAGRRMYILRVHGDSMDRAGIEDGSMVLVDADKQPVNGNIVVALVDHESTIKRFYRTDHTITLSPDSTNPEHVPMTFKSTNDIKIRGVVEFIYMKRIK